MKRSLLKKITACVLTAGLLSVCFVFADSSYKVEKGDTLYSISRKYQITVGELRAANNLSENDVLKAGQKLVIPEADIGTAAALSTSKSNTPKNTETVRTSDYVVAKGDTLYGIARKNGMTVPELLSLNNLDSSVVIKVGQKLKIRADSASSTSSSVLSSNTPEKDSGKNNQNNNDSVNKITTPAPDTRTYGQTVSADSSKKWPVKNPKITVVKGKVSGVQLSAQKNEAVVCVHEGTVMYVGTYRGFGQVIFVQSKTGLIYAYTGLGSVKVKKGEYAMADSELGTAGIDAITGNPQITFMVFQNGQPIDPSKAPRS